MKNKFKDIKNKTILVTTMLVVVGAAWGCDYQTEEPSSIVGRIGMNRPPKKLRIIWIIHHSPEVV